MQTTETEARKERKMENRWRRKRRGLEDGRWMAGCRKVKQKMRSTAYVFETGWERKELKRRNRERTGGK